VHRLTTMVLTVTALAGCEASLVADEPARQVPAALDEELNSSTPYDPMNHVIIERDDSTYGHSLTWYGPEGRSLGLPAASDLPISISSDSVTDSHLASLPAGDTTLYTYRVRVATTFTDPSMGVDVSVAVANGSLVTQADYEAVHANWLADRQAKLAPDLAAANTAIVSAGGTVLEQKASVPIIIFDADEPTVQAVLASGTVQGLYLHGIYTNDSGMGADGASVWWDVGGHTFRDVGEDIDGDSIPEIFDGLGERIAVWEALLPDNPDHPGFFFYPPSSSTFPFAQSSRLLREIHCDVTSRPTVCGDATVVSGQIPGSDREDDTPDGRGHHATTVLGMAIGDLTNGQDYAFPGSVGQSERSFVARGAYADVLSHNGYLWSHQDDAMDGLYDFLVASPEYHITNITWYYREGETSCDGRGRSEDLQDLYEAGQLPVVSAGNFNGSTILPPAPGLCSIVKPADSFVALTVGGLDDGSHWGRSSTGEDPFFGPGRRVVGVAAPAVIDRAYYKDASSPQPTLAGYTDSNAITELEVMNYGPDPDTGEICNNIDDDGDGTVDEGWPDSDSSGIADCFELYHARGTSFAAPIVSGGLAIWREYYTSKYSHLIDDPGILMTQALLASSGAGAPEPTSGSGPVDGFSNAVGGGAFHLRVNDSIDLSPPWAWAAGHLCVEGERDITISPSLPSGVQELRIVAWWSDEPGRRDDIDVHLLQNGFTVASDTADNPRGRIVVRNPPAGDTYTLRFSEVKIRGKDKEDGCGNGRERVYFGWRYASETEI